MGLWECARRSMWAAPKQVIFIAVNTTQLAICGVKTYRP
jgi:hypothetical protein